MTDHDDYRPANPSPDEEPRVRLLEAALVEYVERYGLTPLARAAMMPHEGRAPGED